MIETKKQKNEEVGDGKAVLYAIITGLVSGFVNGIFGGGGGMIVVPMLTYLLKRPQKTAHATAILIILPLSIVSGIFYTLFGNFDVKIGLPAGLGVVGGGLLGAVLLSKLKANWISVIFALVMLFAGAKMMMF